MHNMIMLCDNKLDDKDLEYLNEVKLVSCTNLIFIIYFVNVFINYFSDNFLFLFTIKTFTHAQQTYPTFFITTFYGL